MTFYNICAQKCIKYTKITYAVRLSEFWRTEIGKGDRVRGAENKVRYYRTYYGYTQRELARMAKTAASTICEIESGRLPNAVLAIRIARALRAKVEDLWSDD